MARNNQCEVARLSRYISEFLNDYAPSFLSNSEHTLKSYKDALVLYILFLEEQVITPSGFTRACFEREQIEKWIRWLKEERKCSPDTCNVRLASLRVFLEFVSGLDIKLLYFFQDAKLIKRQKCSKRKVSGLTREAVAAMLAAPDPKTHIGKRDLVFMTLLYATAARLDEVLSIKIKQLHLSKGMRPSVTIIGKGQKTRTMFLLPRAAAHVKKYMDETHGHTPDPDAYLFYSRVDGKYAKLTEPAMDKRLKIHAEKAHRKCPDVPLKIHAHRFRHA